MAEPKPRSLYHKARREAIIILLIWLVSSIYSATFCYLYGYKTHAVVANEYGPTISQLAGPMKSWDRTSESLTFPSSLGIPDWVVHGIVIPWVICIALTFIFCIFIYSEDDLTTDSEESRPE